MTWTNPIEERRNRESAQSLVDRANLVYVATINVPGYLPMMDNVEPFESAKGAWEYLVQERMRDEDSATYETGDPDEFVYSDTLQDLQAAVNALDAQSDRDITDAGLMLDGTGTIGGNTPGYPGSHDLGLNYSVTLVSRETTEDD